MRDQATVAKRSSNSSLESGTVVGSTEQARPRGVQPPLLVVPTETGNGGEGTSPMNVRPFSASESFSFPKPPSAEGHSSSDTHERPANTPDSAQWLAVGSQPAQLNPFEDGHAEGMHTSVPGPTAFTYTPPTFPPAPVSPHTPTAPLTPAASSPATADPFADQHADQRSSFMSMGSTHSVAPIETIRRPFAPTLSDELAVMPGETVRVVCAYDDGWAVVEKVPAPHKGKGKARSSVGTEEGMEIEARGLIPIDCMRGKGEKLPSFLANKRVSSQGMGQAVAI
ncbi:hypothetical protein PLICRDRAFT_164273 [Plicaturopsis crispa FD-325 SS-3]|nr:hypothetical protein PLICRDRAFT_164273 [Plicaturopsis crispa FD-325 SS-3]